MQRQIHLFFLFFVISIGLLHAGQRDRQAALQIASDFFLQKAPHHGNKPQKTPQKAGNVKLVYSVDVQGRPEEAVLYVFEKDVQPGFVIVSGDDRMHDILGYSDMNHFDAENMPPNLRAWLDFYTDEAMRVKSSIAVQPSSTSQAEPVQARASSFAARIAPLLKGIKWDQDAPYNNLCPQIPGSPQRAVTGCVATAMAQVMKFYKWPTTGKGKKSYTSATHNFNLSADFSTVTFYWANMTDTYTASSTNQQKTAVATLMYNCGVAVEMDYSWSSGASTYKMLKALHTNFRYDPSLEYYSRDYYTREEWIDVLKTELNAGRPVLYDGQSKDGGHAFVCDGYDVNGFFHFNWGWGGMSNGYYRISALDPDQQGIGGSSGGYNQTQGIVVGLQPDKGTPLSFPVQLCMEDTIVYPQGTHQRTASITVSVTEFWNIGAHTFSGNIGVALYDQSNELKTVLKENSIFLPSLNGWNSRSFTFNGISSTLPAGTYKLYTVCKKTGSTEWQKVRAKVGVPAFLNVNVTNTELSFSLPAGESPQLRLEELSVKGNLYKDKKGRFSMKLKNEGKEYNSLIALYLESVTDNTVSEYVAMEHCNIAAGETREFVFMGDITLSVGDYKLKALYDPTNTQLPQDKLKPLGAEQTVTIKATPTLASALELTEAISFPDNNNVNSAHDVLTVKLKNTGGYFDGSIIAFVFPEGGGYSEAYLGPLQVTIDTDETQTLQLAGAIGLTPAKYLVIVDYKESVGSWTQLSPTTNSQLVIYLKEGTATSQRPADYANADIVLYPMPADEVLNIKAEAPIRSVSVYSIQGQLVLESEGANRNEMQLQIEILPQGIYVVKVDTATGSKTVRVLKK